MPGLSDRERPVFRGLHWHRHDNYSFFIPVDWHEFSRDDGREGAVYGPDAEDGQTLFAAQLVDLGFDITGEDAEAVAEGFFGSIEALPGVEIEAREQEVLFGPRIHLQARYCFDDGDHRRKRWVRGLYRHHFQVLLIAQGATPEKFRYWLPMFYEAMMTAGVHLQKPQEADLVAENISGLPRQ